MDVICPLCRCEPVGKLGKRSEFRPIAPYAGFVSDIDPYDRDLYECRQCGFQFIHPLYNDDELNGLYNQSGYYAFVESSYPFAGYEDPKAGELLKSWKHKFLSAGLESWLAAYQASHSTRPTFLDVGCGRGHNMLIFRDLGFDVLGIDLSDIQLQYVRDRLGLDVRKMSLEDLDETEKFDCVLAAHVIEHVTCPHTFMESVRGVLKPDGLLIIETPLTMDWGVQRQRYSDIYHTFFFDHFTLALLAAMHGLAYRQSINVMWRNDANFVDMVVCLRADAALNESNISDAHIRAFRPCHDRLQEDYLRHARYYLAKESDKLSLWEVAVRGWRHLLEHGMVATTKRTVQFFRDRYANRSGA